MHIARPCLSPEVSFSLSGSLLVAGGYCIEKAVRGDRSYLPLAIIPAVFGLQQFCEGWVWTGLHRGQSHLVTIAAIAYLFFALCFWPVWVPLSMLFVQRRRRVHLLLFAMTGIGIAIGITVLVPLLIEPSWLRVDVDHHSLHYNVSSSPAFRVLPNAMWQALYFFAVATPLLVSGSRKLMHFGMALILSAAATHILLPDTFASAWCCFAAAMSLYVVTIFYRLPRGRSVPAPG
jgi:hypothetical protein